MSCYLGSVALRARRGIGVSNNASHMHCFVSTKTCARNNLFGRFSLPCGLSCRCGHFGCHSGLSVSMAGAAALSVGVTNGIGGTSGPCAKRNDTKVLVGVCCSAPFSDPKLISNGLIGTDASCPSLEVPFANNDNVKCCNKNFVQADGGALGTSIRLGRGLSFVAGKLSFRVGKSCGDNFASCARTDTDITACAPMLRRSNAVTCGGCKRGSRLGCRSGSPTGSHS